MKKFITFIKEYWNFYMSIVLSTIISYLNNWNANILSAVNQYIGITISLMCLLTLVKFILFPNNKKNFVERMIPNNEIKNVNRIIDNEILEEESKIMKKGINVMGKFLKTYKGAIISTLIFVCTALIQLIDLFVGSFSGLIGTKCFEVIQICSCGASVIIGILSYGFGSPKLKELIAQLKDQLDGDDTKEINKINDIKYLEKQVVHTEKAIANIKKEYASYIEEYERSYRLGIPCDSAIQNKVVEYKDKLNAKENLLNSYNAKLQELQN